jgi:hypothetical protein
MFLRISSQLDTTLIFDYTGKCVAYSLVVVRREQPKIVGQRENFLMHRLVQLMRIALLKVGATAASDQQRVASKSDALERNWNKIM